MKAQKIIWDDAGSFGSGDIADMNEVWYPASEIIAQYHNALFINISFGIVLHEDENSVIIAQSHDTGYKQFANPLRIPKGMILDRIDVDLDATNS